ncbi:hypothetical protein GQ44DRAFT_724275 [Phaeosphaeriaceae sp. PMI808]|nr:hypothetical protein GQ44DRAFT_724275 [Phaeosphaeriaceae sp. PMI808]
MAEAPGPLGISLGGLSFIFGTAANAAKFFNTLKNRRQQNKTYRSRVLACRNTYIRWGKCWRMARFEQDDDDTIKSLTDLASTIDEAITKNLKAGLEKKAWGEMRDSSRKGIFSLPHSYKGNVCDNIRYALWKKEVLDGWVERLEKATKATDNLFQHYVQIQTAGYFGDTASLEQSMELAKLQSLFENLESMATGLFHACTGASSNHTIPSGSYNWALGL